MHQVLQTDQSQTTPGAPDTAAVAEVLALDGPGVRRRRYRRVLLILGALVLVAVIATIALLARSRSQQVSYVTQEATRGDLVVAVTATGTLQPTDQVEIGSEISGTVRTVDVDYNDTVRKGQVLARLDTSRMQAQERQLQAALASARARVLQATATRDEAARQHVRLTRMRALTGNESPSESDVDAARSTLDRAEADLASLRAQVTQAEASLQAQRTDLAKAVIRSPIDGVVLERSVEPGQTVAATLQAPVLFVLAEDLTRMELHVDVDEADVSQVRAGQEATFSVDAWPDREFVARVEQIRYGAQTVSGVVTYEGILVVDNTARELRPGMTATAEIVTARVTDATLVPSAALRFSPPTQNARPASTGSLVSRLMPRPPTMRSAPRSNAASARTPQAQVWTLIDREPVARAVKIGASDGVSTQITAGDVQPGTAVIVDVATAGS